MKTNTVIVKFPASGKVLVVVAVDPVATIRGLGVGVGRGETLGVGLGEGLGLPLGGGELFAWAKG